jgi:branched-chain amino acid transport system permease protein
MLFISLLAEGLTTGCAIGVVAMSFSLIYSTTRVFHVAHAGIFTLAGYVAWMLAARGLPFAASLLAAVAICALAGFLIQNQLYERLLRRGASPLVLLIASLGALAILQSGMAAIFSPDILNIASSWGSETRSVAGLTLSLPQLCLLVSGPLLLGAVLLWSRFSMLGRRARAVAANSALAEVMRLNPGGVRALVMALASGVVAIPGCFIALDRGVQPYTGTLILLTATIAMIVGGIGNLAGAFAAAIILSVLQSLSTLVLPGDWSAAATFGLFIIVMIVTPAGPFAMNRR